MKKRSLISESEKERIRSLYNLNESLPDLDVFPIKGDRYNIGYDQNWDDFTDPRRTANTDYSRKATHAGAGGHLKGHIGVDIFGPKGTPILAPVDGKVKYGGNGLTVIIEDPESGYSHWLGHLDSISVDENDFVFAGQQVGTLGNSGNASGTAPHLHYNIYKTSGGFYSGEDPIDVLKKSMDNEPKDIEDLEYDEMGDTFKEKFKKFFGVDNKDETTDEDRPATEAEDEFEIWDVMKKTGSAFMDKIKGLFN
jgi:murein DD-endopeptidase MepM/ murein hydrolase activator NlpD